MRYSHWLFAVPLLCTAGTVSAQQQFANVGTFTMRGRVLDMSDHAVVGAIIRIADAHEMGVSDSVGNFAIERMLPGVYQVEVVGDGFTPLNERIDIEPDHFMLARVQTRAIAITLEVALDLLKERRARTAATARTWDARQLQQQPGSMRDLLLDNGVKLLLCGRMGAATDPDCAPRGSSVTVVSVYVDEILAPSMPLTQLLPRDYAFAEYYPSMAMLRLYSSRFLRRLQPGEALEFVQ